MRHAWLFVIAVTACRLGFDDRVAPPDGRPDAAPDPIDAPVQVLPDAPADAPASPTAYAVFTLDGDPSQGIVATDPTYTGSCTACPTSVAGHLGNAISFDTTTAVTLSFSVGASPYTIAVWFSTAAQGSLLAKPYDLVSVDDVVNIATDGNGGVTYETYDGTNPSYLQSTAPSVFDGAWHHVAITWDGATKALYLDGALQGTATTPALDAAQPLVLGTDTDVGSPAVQYQGALDELRFYASALDAAAIARLAQQ